MYLYRLLSLVEARNARIVRFTTKADNDVTVYHVWPYVDLTCRKCSVINTMQWEIGGKYRSLRG